MWKQWSKSVILHVQSSTIPQIPREIGYNVIFKFAFQLQIQTSYTTGEYTTLEYGVYEEYGVRIACIQILIIIYQLCDCKQVFKFILSLQRDNTNSRNYY